MTGHVQYIRQSSVNLLQLSQKSVSHKSLETLWVQPKVKLPWLAVAANCAGIWLQGSLARNSTSRLALKPLSVPTTNKKRGGAHIVVRFFKRRLKSVSPPGAITQLSTRQKKNCTLSFWAPNQNAGSNVARGVTIYSFNRCNGPQDEAADQRGPWSLLKPH